MEARKKGKIQCWRILCDEVQGEGGREVGRIIGTRDEDEVAGEQGKELLSRWNREKML